MRLSTPAIVVAIVLAIPVVGFSQQPMGVIHQAVERSALGMGLQSDAARNRRSMGRTWAGVSMIAVGGLLASANTKTTLCINGSCTSETKWYKPLGYTGVGLVVSGVLLATVWSDVPTRPSIDFSVTPNRIQVSKTFGF